MKRLILPSFILLVLVQWIVPGQIFWKKEQVILKGKEFRFETEPVDPSHPFTGKYIRLNFRADTFTSPLANKLLSQDIIYVELETNKKGFAEIKQITKEKPGHTTDYIEAEVAYIANVNPGPNNQAHIAYPFVEYYMDEYKAPRAEQLYRSANADSSLRTYAIVKVFKGDAVTTNVIINDRPIKDWFR